MLMLNPFPLSYYGGSHDLSQAELLNKNKILKMYRRVEILLNSLQDKAIELKSLRT